MSGELNIKRRPFGFRIFWTVVYVSVSGLVLYLASSAAMGIRTNTLPSGSVQLTVPYSKYVVGETVSFTIKNNYNGSIDIINNCPYEPLAVYFYEDGVWVRKHDRVKVAECPNGDRQVSVGAGKSIESNFGPWRNLFHKPGKYRIVAFVEYYNELPYQDIDIVDPVSAVQPAQQKTIAPIVVNNPTQATKPVTTTSSPVVVQTKDDDRTEDFDD